MSQVTGIVLLVPMILYFASNGTLLFDWFEFFRVGELPAEVVCTDCETDNIVSTCFLVKQKGC